MSLEAPGHAVDDLIAALAEALGDDLDREQLDELGDRADEIVSMTDLSELVAAIGLGEGDKGSTSLPAAIATGEPREVATLRSLLTASKLPDAGEEQKEQLVDELSSLVETAQTEPSDEREPAEKADSDSAESTEKEPEAEAKSTEKEPKAEAESTEKTAEDESESTDETTDSSDEAESEDTDSSIRQLLKSQLQETLDIFDEESELSVENLTNTFTEDDETTAGSTGSSDKQTDKKADKKTDKAADDDTDQSTQSDQSRDGTRWRPGGRGRTTHSTISTARRRDIGRSGQLSTIRGSTVSKR